MCGCGTLTIKLAALTVQTGPYAAPWLVDANMGAGRQARVLSVLGVRGPPARPPAFYLPPSALAGAAACLPSNPAEPRLPQPTCPPAVPCWPQVECGDAEVAKKVEEKVGQFTAWVQKHPGQRGQVRRAVREAGEPRGVLRLIGWPECREVQGATCADGVLFHTAAAPTMQRLWNDLFNFDGTRLHLSAGVPVFLREAPAPELVQVRVGGPSWA